MDHIRILKRAFSVTTSYRALWIFGILLALVSGGDFSGSSGGDGSGDGSFPNFELSPEALNALIVAGVVALCVALVLTVAAVGSDRELPMKTISRIGPRNMSSAISICPAAVGDRSMTGSPA